MPLRPISRDNGYDFPLGAWDVRGWTVRTEADDDRVGKVDDMLLDGGGRLRYLDVDLGLLKKHVLVPLEHARADRETETVWIEGMNAKQIEDVPEYALEPESLDEAYEHRLAAVYGDATRVGAPGASMSAESGARPLEMTADDEAELELRRMETLEDEYKVSDPDPRGWDVVTADGRTVGEVSELLMDPGQMRARYLDVAVDEKKLDLERVDRHILLPADRVRVERNKKRVIVGGLFAADLRDYPQYGGLPVRAKTARDLDTFFERPGTGPGSTAGDAAVREPGARELAEMRDPSLRHFYGTSPAGRPITGEERPS